MNNILLFGLIGHVLGDFYFQSNSLSKEKEGSVRAMFMHCLLYCIPFLLTSFFLVKSPQLVAFLLLCGVCHMVIDGAKYLFSVHAKGRVRKTFSKKSAVFIVDQFLHISSIILLALYFSEVWEIHCISIVTRLLSQIPYDSHTLAKGILTILLILKPVNITYSKLFYNYKPPVEHSPKEEEQLLNPKLSYINAGEMIGCLERLIIVIFLTMNQYSAIGFVLTAKSVARYDNIAHNKQFAEYFLIGTLYSLMASMAVYLTVSML